MSKIYDDLSQAANENAAIAGSSTHSQPEASGRHRLILDVPALDETVKFVQRVFVFPSPQSPRVVVFSSMEDQSSHFCYRAGSVLAAQVSGSVCLVDAKLGAPSLHALLDSGTHAGLAEALVEPGPITKFAKRVSRNLWVLPCGSRALGVQALSATNRLRSRMEDLRTEFAYVLINTSPVSSNADAVLLGQMADGIILVVEANSTRREAARIAKETIENAKVRLLGVVLTNRKFPIPEAIYRKL